MKKPRPTRKYPPRPHKDHLGWKTNDDTAICGKPIDNSKCQSVDDFLDWGYNGKTWNLCELCAKQAEKELLL